MVDVFVFFFMRFDIYKVPRMLFYRDISYFERFSTTIYIYIKSNNNDVNNVIIFPKSFFTYFP